MDITIIGTGRDTLRDWGHAKDYVRMQWMMLQQDQPEDFAIATGVQYSARQFNTWTAEALGMQLRWEGEGINEVAYWTNPPVSVIAGVEAVIPGAEAVIAGAEVVIPDLTRDPGSPNSWIADQVRNDKPVSVIAGSDPQSMPPEVPDVPVVRIDPRYFRPTEVETLLGDPTKAKEKLGWVPEITAQEMCAEMVAYDLAQAKQHGYSVNVSVE